MGMLHEDRAPTTGVIHPRRPAEGRKGNDARTGRQRRARIRDRHRLERIPHHHAIPQHHRLTTKTSLKHHKSSYRPVRYFSHVYQCLLFGAEAKRDIPLKSLRFQGNEGGASRVRTGDPLLAKQMRYQLRYSPIGEKSGYAASLPSTWAREDLNLRPHPYQGCALTS